MVPNGAFKRPVSAVSWQARFECTADRAARRCRLLAYHPANPASGVHLVSQYPSECPGVICRPVSQPSSRGRRPELAAESRQSRSHQFSGRVTRALVERRLLRRRKKRKRLFIRLLHQVGPDNRLWPRPVCLRDCARRVEDATNTDGPNGRLGVLAITHYNRLLEELIPDRVHILVKGRFVASGGPELADELERSGYESFTEVPVNN